MPDLPLVISRTHWSSSFKLEIWSASPLFLQKEGQDAELNLILEAEVKLITFKTSSCTYNTDNQNGLGLCPSYNMFNGGILASRANTYYFDNKIWF